MRKTRLVILPTKCLHQMGFLLLFLSCPVIGDWGRIRPESETSHDAIRIEREGTCGLQRDSPGGILDILDANGFDQCRRSESNDLKEPTTREASYGSRFDLRRRTDVRESLLRRAVNERREGEVERNSVARRELRNARERLESRSRSVEARRTSAVRSRSLERRNDVNARSFNRLDDESRGMRRTRSVETRVRREVSNEARARRDVTSDARARRDVTSDARARRDVLSDTRARRDVTSDARARRDVTNDARARRDVTNDARARREVAAERVQGERRLSLARRTLERENERRVEQQRRMAREIRSERRESERTIRVARERRERESNERSFRRSTERRELERRETQREHDERSIERLALSRRESMPRRVASEERNVIQPKDRRLSLARVEQDKTQRRRVERSDNRRSLDAERRVADIRKSRSLEFRRSIDEIEKSGRLARKADARRETEMRRSVSLPRKLSETRDERRVSLLDGKMERLEGLRTSRLNAGLKKEMIEDIKLGEKDPEDEKFFGGIMKRMGLKHYPALEVGDWTTNCVIGVAAYLIHSRKAKAA